MSGILQNVQKVANYIQGGIVPSPAEVFLDDIQEPITPLGIQQKDLAIARIDVPFSAADFTGSGAMTWTVEVGDVIAFYYTIINKLMIVWFELMTTSIAGVRTNTLRIRIPNGEIALIDAFSLGCFNRVNSETFSLVTTSGSTNLELQLWSGIYPASVNDAFVGGQIAFWIQ
jgi:uncharacterized membrane protein YgcG